MSRSVKTHITRDEIDGPMDMRAISKDEFGRRLYAAMLNRDMRQSDLARAAGIQRSSVSNYVRGLAFPAPLVLQKLAEVLRVAPADLLPNHTVDAVRSDKSAFSLSISQTDPSRSHVRLDMWLPTEIATQIANLVSKNNNALVD